MLTIGRKEDVVLKIPTRSVEGKNLFIRINVEAKIDSGAYGNSMHIKKCIEPYYSTINKCHGALIILDTDREIFLKSSDYFFKNVKNSSGRSERRLATKLKILVGKKTYKTTFTFTNREGLRNKILLGRQLLKNRFLIDVSKTNLLSV